MDPRLSRSLGASLTLCLSLFVTPSYAEMRSGDTVVVHASEVVEENLYASGGTVAIRGAVRGDLVVAGGTVLIDGEVTGDVLAAGGQISISGRVEGDVRAAGGQVSIMAPVGGEAVVAGGDVHLAAPVSGDALLAGGDAIIDGPIGGELYSTAGETRIGDEVAGDVRVTGGRLLLEDRASVGGDVDYTGPRTLEREEGARVAGSITQRRGGSDGSGIQALLYGWLQLLVGLFVLGLLFLLVFRGFAERSMATLKGRPGKSVALGLATFIGVPVVIGLVFFIGAFVGGAWLGVFGLALYGIALALCFPLLAASLALELVARMKRGPTSSWWPMLLGLIVLTALLFIPVLGPLVAFATVLFGLGAIVLTMIPTLRFTSRPTAETAPRPSTPAMGATAAHE